MLLYFFLPSLITFSDSEDIADGHQTVQNVNYDWVEPEHKGDIIWMHFVFLNEIHLILLLSFDLLYFSNSDSS